MKKGILIFCATFLIFIGITNAAPLMPGARAYDTGIPAKSVKNTITGMIFYQPYMIIPVTEEICYLSPQTVPATLDATNYGYDANFPNTVSPESMAPPPAYSATLPPPGQWSGSIIYTMIIKKNPKPIEPDCYRLQDITVKCFFQFRQNPINGDIEIAGISNKELYQCVTTGATNLVMEPHISLFS